MLQLFYLGKLVKITAQFLYYNLNLILKRNKKKLFKKRVIFQKNNQPTKNDEGAGCIYTLVRHFVLSKKSCISSNRNLC